MTATNIDIARQVRLSPIADIASRLGLGPDDYDFYGKYKAKFTDEGLKRLASRPEGKLILVTAISPTPAGEGKTTTSIGLADGLNRIGRKTVVCLREPSTGPVFGMKGGATGAGRAQVAPMDEINLHFTGDFHAIGVANNLLAAMIDNHIHHGNELGIDVRRISWKRALDISDRALREITVGLGGVANGYPRQDGFDIVVASEIMAVLCLATSVSDLKQRLGEMIVAQTRDQKPVRARDLGAQGALAALLKDAMRPNLVQTLEHTPALIHGGPFANIAHGCNSVIATRTALRLADFVITEAGFGADLGAEKFLHIKCRKSGLRPSAAVIVATLRALKYHGGAPLERVQQPDPDALKKGLPNLLRHLENLRERFGLPCVVALNHFEADTEAEVDLLTRELQAHDTRLVVSRHWAEGGAGAQDLARAVAEVADRSTSTIRFVYDESLSLWEKMRAIAREIYGAADISGDSRVKNQLKKIEEQGFGHLPICVAKTQYSFTSDPQLRGAPAGHIIPIREVRLSAGAGFVVMICGEMMTMPGLPKIPAALKIDLDDAGNIQGLG